MFTQEDIVYVNSRKEAIEDGVQALIYDDLRQESGIKFPVYFTSSVIAIVEKTANGKSLASWEGIIWDIFTMFKYFARGKNTDRFLFQVKIGKKNHVFKAMIGATDFDDASPAITIMLQDED